MLHNNSSDKTIELCDSKNNDFNVKKINVLSGLLIDRKNKFLFVGEGNFSFTVAFNAYRQFLWDKYDNSLLGVFNQQHVRNYAYSPCLMIRKLIVLHESSITGEVIKKAEKLRINPPRKLVQCLEVSNLESQEATKYQIKIIYSKEYVLANNPPKAFIQINSGNEYDKQISVGVNLESRDAEK